ncbi:hypothetical protein PybrP1_004036 [[Pythium] brassicae (nom. inval.)]|nr:hypothetical protein PybrP1_004036 [[Pythium] brassicae (nom. inval.)]
MKNLRDAGLALVVAFATSATLDVEASTTHLHWTTLESDNYSIADACKPQEWAVKQAKVAALQLHFASLDLAGHKLVVSAPDGSAAQEFSSESALHDVTTKEFSSESALHDVTTKVIPGSAAKISFQPSTGGATAAAACGPGRLSPSFALDKVLGLWSNKLNVKKEAQCGVVTVKNPQCFTGEMYKMSKSVLQFSRAKPNGEIGVCTAWLWGKTGLVLTNNHCVQVSAQTLNATLLVHKEIDCKADCTIATCKVAAAVYGWWGEIRLLKTNEVLDYTLLQITNKQKVADLVKNFGYLKLQRAPTKVGDQIYIVQHPNGHAKKIAATDDDSGSKAAKIESTNFRMKLGANFQNGLLKYSADTDNGSSGSPVISRSSNAVVGMHRAGRTCENVATPANVLLDELEMYLPGIDGVKE